MHTYIFEANAVATFAIQAVSRVEALGLVQDNDLTEEIRTNFTVSKNVGLRAVSIQSEAEFVEEED